MRDMFERPADLLIGPNKGAPMLFPRSSHPDEPTRPSANAAEPERDRSGPSGYFGGLCDPAYDCLATTWAALNDLMDDLGARAPERAGLLFGPRDTPYLVTHFVPDESGQGTPSSFRLDVESLNRVIRRMRRANLSCQGIVHSHPGGVTRPSHGDVTYLTRLFRNPRNAKTERVLFPIVAEGRFHPYVVEWRDERCHVRRAPLVLV